MAPKCRVELDDVPDICIFDDFDNGNLSLYRNIREEHVILDRMFSVIQTNNRSGQNVLPSFKAKKSCENDTFPFRVSRPLRKKIGRLGAHTFLYM